MKILVTLGLDLSWGRISIEGWPSAAGSGCEEPLNQPNWHLEVAEAPALVAGCVEASLHSHADLHVFEVEVDSSLVGLITAFFEVR